MYMFVSGDRKYLCGPVKTQNHVMSEWAWAIFPKRAGSKKVCPCTVREVWLTKVRFLIFALFTLFLLLASGGKELLTKTWTVQVSLPFPLLLWGGAEVYFSRSSASSSPPPLFLLARSSPRRKQVWLFILGFYGLSTTLEQCSVIDSGLSGSSWHGVGGGGSTWSRYPGLFVTKNPHSPTVWSAGASSKVGRGGSQSTAQSSLCLDW